MTNIETINAYFEEAESWAENSDSDCSLIFALRNGFKLHAVSMWIGTGASALNLPVKISRKKELEEINQLLNMADVFICQDCNHHGFYEKSEKKKLSCCQCCSSKNIKLDDRSNK